MTILLTAFVHNTENIEHNETNILRCFWNLDGIGLELPLWTVMNIHPVVNLDWNSSPSTAAVISNQSKNNPHKTSLPAFSHLFKAKWNIIWDVGGPISAGYLIGNLPEILFGGSVHASIQMELEWTAFSGSLDVSSAHSKIINTFSWILFRTD